MESFTQKNPVIFDQTKKSQLSISMLEQSSDWVWCIDLQGIHTYSNSAIYLLLGYRIDEVVSVSAFPLMHPDDIATVRKMLNDKIASRQGWKKVNVRWLHKNGSVRYFESSAEPFYSNEGLLEGFSGIDRDVTDFHEQQVELKLHKNILEELVEQRTCLLNNLTKRLEYAEEIGRTGCIEYNLKNKEIFWSFGIYELYGIDRKITPSLPITLNLVHPDDRLKVEKCLHDIISKKLNYDLDHRMIRRDNGKVIWVHARAKLEYDELGQPALLRGSVVDITSRKNAEKVIRASEEKISLLLDSLPVVSYKILCGEDFPVIYMSSSVQKYTGYDTQQFIDNPSFWSEKVHPDDVYVWRKNQQKRSYGEDISFEYRFQTLNGDYKWFYDLAHFEKSEEAIVGYIVGTLIDISERKNIEHQHLQINKLKALSTLAGGIAHDFNNILASIIGFSELALLNVDNNSKESSYLQVINQEGQRAADLVRQIVIFSRMDHKEHHSVNVYQVVDESLRAFESSLPKNIRLIKNLSANSCTLLADDSKLKLLFAHLLTNAIQAMEENGGILDVTLSQEDEQTCAEVFHNVQSINQSSDYLQLVISDTGVGISEENKSKVFDPFFTTKDVDHGTGLGLAVVYSIVESHQGLIHLQSEINQGTQVRILLPVKQEKRIQQKTLIDADKKRKNDHEMPHILLVDDEPHLLELNRIFIQSFGYNVSVCHDGLEALDLYLKNPDKFSLVYTDQKMPNMTGKQLAIKLLQLNPNLPIILTTGYSNVISKRESQELGIRYYLEKPVVLELLIETIRQCLELKISPIEE